MAKGTISGSEYSKKDILNSVCYLKMQNEPLLDEDDCLVIPVRNQTSPHYRKLGSPSFKNRIGRNENNPSHNECVQNLLDKLTSKEFDSIEFSTYVFEDEGSRIEQIIFVPLIDSNYFWFMENDARIAFSDETYIQPDLAGRDSKKFSPRSAYPNIIIEVIRTHHPELETFKKLFELSKSNYHIYFYFIAENRKGSKLNHIREENNIFKIRLSHYMIDGNLFKNGKLFSCKKETQSFEHWYKFVKNSFFISAKEKI